MTCVDARLSRASPPNPTRKAQGSQATVAEPAVDNSGSPRRRAGRQRTHRVENPPKPTQTAPGKNAVRRDLRGLALVTVFWVLMLLALVAASFMRTTGLEINLIRNLIENAKALA